MTSWQSHTVRADDGVALHVETGASATAPVTVVFLHGWCLSAEIWRYQCRDLPAKVGHDVRMVTYDVRGHGRSGPAPVGSTTIAQLASDLRTVLDNVAADDPVVLVGHSMGGMTVMALAETNPEMFGDRVAGVVLVNTSSGNLSALTLNLPAPLARVVRRALPMEFGRRHSRHQRRELRRGELQNRIRRVDTAIARWLLFGTGARRDDVRLGRHLISSTHPSNFAGFFHSLMEHERGAALAAMSRVPVHVFAGGRDRLTPPRHGVVIAEAIPSARLSVLPGAGHMIPLERADLFTDRVAQLVREVTPVAPSARAASVPQPVQHALA